MVKKKNQTVQIDMQLKASLLPTPAPQPHFSGTSTSFWCLLEMSAYVWAYEYIHIPFKQMIN